MRGLGDAKTKLGPARKALLKMAREAEPISAPLPGPVRERQERKAGYETTKEDITKWQPLVKVSLLEPSSPKAAEQWMYNGNREVFLIQVSQRKRL